MRYFETHAHYNDEVYNNDLDVVLEGCKKVGVDTIVNIGYNKEQYLKALQEANNHKGPSLIIAYAPCIEHGIKSGMENSLDDAYLASKCGYFLTFRYNPDNKTFNLDSKDIDMEVYDQFLANENRYANLKKVNPDGANLLLEEQKEWAKNRYEYYSKL